MSDQTGVSPVCVDTTSLAPETSKNRTIDECVLQSLNNTAHPDPHLQLAWILSIWHLCMAKAAAIDKIYESLSPLSTHTRSTTPSHTQRAHAPLQPTQLHTSHMPHTNTLYGHTMAMPYFELTIR